MKKLSNITESVWGDIRKRSTGETIRKEDDISSLGITDFFWYLRNRYEQIDSDDNWIDKFLSQNNVWKIQLPIEQYGNNKISPITICFNGETEKVTDLILASKLVLPEYYPEAEKILSDKYKLEYPGKDHGVFSAYVVPKNGSLTNNVCIDVIDKILNMVKHPLLKKTS